MSVLGPGLHAGASLVVSAPSFDPFQSPLRGFDDGLVLSLNAFSTAGGATRLLTNGPTNVAAPGSTVSASSLPAVQDILVDVTITDLGDTQRRVDIVWRTENGQRFIAPGTQLNGEAITRMEFLFGNVFGLADATFNNAFNDPLYGGIESSVGTLFNSAGTVLFNSGLFTSDDPNGSGWVGGIFIFGQIGGVEADLTNSDLARYEASVVYNLIPAPGTCTLLLGGGLLAARRRRA
ncbi:MAG: hypothetical protein EA378_01735 [Phycisphaerales bacterium]|nr:MAG: hypothetical protein EA378_01735 [Phycisphaerales bacterium]